MAFIIFWVYKVSFKIEISTLQYTMRIPVTAQLKRWEYWILNTVEAKNSVFQGIDSLQGLIETKVDNVTFNVMRTAEKFADPDSLNLLIEKESPRVK